jgi:hypothetical protein
VLCVACVKLQCHVRSSMTTNYPSQNSFQFSFKINPIAPLALLAMGACWLTADLNPVSVDDTVTK